MKTTLLALLLPAFAAGQSITYTYPQLGMAPCNQFIECGDTTCSACENPVNSAPTFFGVHASWFGVTACPEVVTTSDDCINVEGWPTVPDTTARVVYSGLALVPMYIDSVIIVHRSADLARLQVSFGINTTTQHVVVADVATDPGFITTVITGLGCVAPDSGNVFGTYQMHLQPYQGSGTWTVDAVRVVATPCTGMGIEDHLAPGERRSGPAFDLLGRRSRVTFPGL